MGLDDLLGSFRHAQIAAMVGLIGLVGCTDLESYATTGDETYRGRIVGLESAVVRRGFADETELALRFDPSRAASLSTPPGFVTTSDASLIDVPLEPITPLAHDALSEYEIPSGARVRNYIFVLRPAEGPLAGREPMVFLSLMTDGTIELRIIAGGGQQPGDYFGVFMLTRSDL